MRLGELGAEAVDVVVGAAHADQLGAVDAGREQLLLLEVGGDEDVGLQAGRGGVGGDGVGEVAGRGAGDGVEAELARLGDGDGDDAVLERVGRVGGVVLDPELAADAQPLRQPVGAQQRRQAGLERVARAPLKRQEVGVAPDPGRARLDLALLLGGVDPGEVVVGLQRPEALLADVERLERVLGPAFLAFERFESHLVLKKPPPGESAEVRKDFHIFQALNCIACWT